MKKFSAVAVDKISKERIFIENKEYSRKTDFIYDLRKNGYRVNPDKVKESHVFDHIIKNTNCEPWNWKNNK